jgi:nicotinamide-nucleotide adenylyltransferase
VIFRAQPITIAMLEIVKHNRMFGGELIVGIGSSNRSMDSIDPLTYEEREQMVFLALAAEGLKARIIGIPDTPGDDRAWPKNIIELVGADPQNIVVSTRSAWTSSVCEYAGMKIYRHPEFYGGLSGSVVRGMIRAENTAWKALVPHEAVLYLENVIDGRMTGIQRIKATAKK